MTHLRLRRYCPEDRAACLAMLEGNIPAAFFPHEIPVFVEFLDCFTGAYLVVEEAGAVVACGGLAEDTSRVILCWGLVGRENQRRGIGRFLLQARLALAVCIGGARHVDLHTSQRTAPFFENAGFKTRRVTPNAYGPGLHRHDMTLHLAPARRQMIGADLVTLQAAGHSLAI